MKTKCLYETRQVDMADRLLFYNYSNVIIMVEIPSNPNTKDYKADIAKQIISLLKENNEVYLYKSQMTNGSVDQYIEVAREFKKKGYYCKVNYFVESWKGVQCVVVSKVPLQPVNARLVYSEML